MTSASSHRPLQCSVSEQGRRKVHSVTTDLPREGDSPNGLETSWGLRVRRRRLILRPVIDRRLIPLALGAFVVASDGTLVVGLLRQIARSLAVSPAAAGQAVTVFA